MRQPWIAWGITALLTGCAIDTEPIPQGADSGFAGGGEGVDLGGLAAGGAGGQGGDGGSNFNPDAALDLMDAGAAPPRFDSCDVDLTCTAGCDDDLDCAMDTGTPVPDAAPASLADAVGREEALGLLAGQDAWFAWPPEVAARGVQLAGAEGATPDAVLVLYDAEWAAVARAEPSMDPATPLMIELPADLASLPEGGLVLRIHARSDLENWTLSFVE